MLVTMCNATGDNRDKTFANIRLRREFVSYFLPRVAIISRAIWSARKIRLFSNVHVQPTCGPWIKIRVTIFPMPTLVGIHSLNSFKNIRSISRSNLRLEFSTSFSHLYAVENIHVFAVHGYLLFSSFNRKGISKRTNITIWRTHSSVLCRLLHRKVIRFNCEILKCICESK